MDERIERDSRGFTAPTPDPRCGTGAGYQAHRTRKERHCEPCLIGSREEARRRASVRRDGEVLARRPATCGTVSGRQVHQRAGTPPCDPCKEAARLDNRRKKAENPERYMRASRRSNWRLQGMNPDEAELALKSHDGFCDICKTQTPGERNWHIDHDHATGAIRGVLCGGCNKGLGQFRDNPSALYAAIGYLAKYGTS